MARKATKLAILLERLHQRRLRRRALRRMSRLLAEIYAAEHVRPATHSNRVSIGITR